MEPDRPPVSTAGFWDDLYVARNDGWELGGPAPPLEDWLATGGKFEAKPGTNVRGDASGSPADRGSAGARGSSADRGSAEATGSPADRGSTEARGLTADEGSAGAIGSSAAWGSAGARGLSAAWGSAGARGSSADWGSAGAISGPPHKTIGQSPRLAIPGCGRGHDARLLARHGYRVTAFDFAAPAVAEARRLAAAEGVDVAVEQRDIFTLGQDYAGAFDGVWEYTCFCAIDPARRDEYARVLHTILRPGGLLLACFYPLRGGDDGPPFPVSHRDIDRALAGRFTVLRAGPPGRSIERRRGLEWLVAARRP